MRHLAVVGSDDGSNPYGRLVPLAYYAYHANMRPAGATSETWYGDVWRWGSAKLGYVNLEEGRRYDIEHYVKMNTVIGPFDKFGNGTAREDGIVRGWLNGVLVFERTNVVLRKHPAIKIDEVWLDHYHGGMTPAERAHEFAMDSLVVARKYIGPLRAQASAERNKS